MASLAAPRHEPAFATIPVILNPASGGGHPDIANEIAGLFHEAAYHADIVILKTGEDPIEASRNRAKGGASTVVAAGGDGTVNAVASGLMGSPAALGVLPIGRLNHFAKDLRIPLAMEKAVSTIAARHVVRIDMGTVNDRAFVNNSSVGIYPSLVEAREQERRRGHSWLTASALAAIRMLQAYRGLVVRIAVDGREVMSRTPFVFVGNNEYEIEGLSLGGRARLDGGQLYTYLAPHLRTRDMPAMFARALVGRARQTDAFEIIASSEISVDLPRARRARIAVDGELTTLTPPLRYRIRRGALNVIVPRE